MGDDQAIVIDNGSGFCKVGFAGEDRPRVELPSVLARDRLPSGAAHPSDVFVGHEAQNRRGPLIRTSPIEHGVIKNWDDMEKIWHHAFHNELHIDPSDYTVFLTDGSEQLGVQAERMCEVMFETFQVQKVYVQNPAPLSLVASGRSSGIVLDSGHDVTQVIAFFSGMIYDPLKFRMDFAGLDLSLYLTKMLNERGYSFTTATDREIVQGIKEKMCYVALDYEMELNSATSKSYELPDGTTIALGQESFLCPEVLFNPSLIGKDGQGVHHAVLKNMTALRLGLKEKTANIVLAGGSTMFKGFADRLTKEVTTLVHKNINVLAEPERGYSAWVGSSVLALNPLYRQMHLSRAEYEAEGTNKVLSWRF